LDIGKREVGSLLGFYGEEISIIGKILYSIINKIIPIIMEIIIP
jgi:hypothetical protein